MRSACFFSYISLRAVMGTRCRRIYRHLVAGALVLLLANVGTDVLAGMPGMYRAAWFLAYLLYAPLL